MGALTTGIVLAFALVLVILFGGFSVVLWVLSRNIFQIVGGALLIIVALSYTNLGQFRLPRNIATTFIVVGGLLLIIPTIA